MSSKIENDILSYGIEKKDIINLDGNSNSINEFYNDEFNMDETYLKRLSYCPEKSEIQYRRTSN